MKKASRVRALMTLLLASCLLLGASVKVYGQSGPRAADAEDELLRRLDEAQKLKENGKYQEALPLAEQALAFSRKALGPDHPGTAMSLNRVASLYQARGEYARAEPLFRQSLETYEKGLGPEDIAVAQALNNLGLLYVDQGEYGRAEPLFQRAVNIYEKVQGPGHPEAGPLMNNLGELYRRTGSYEKAEQIIRKALEIAEKALGPQHPQVAIFLNNLAALYREKGDYVQAESLYQRSLNIYGKAFGAGHPDTATMINNLGELYNRKGDYVRAEVFSKQALNIFEKTLGPEHPGLVPALNSLASIYYITGRYEQAVPLYRRALTIREKALGAEHPDVATSLNNIAFTHLVQGDYPQAEQLYRRALAAYEKALGPSHPAVARSLSNLASVYIVRRDPDGAEPLLKRAVAVAEKALGPEHPDTATYLQNLALLYQAKGQIPLALSLLTRSNDIRERHLSRVLATGSVEQKLSYMATLEGETDATITLHTRSAPGDGQAARLALTTVLRRKGRVLEAVADQMATLRNRLDPRDRALLEQLTSTRSRLAALLQKGGGGDPRQYEAALAKLLMEEEKLEQAVSSRSAEYRAQSQPVTLERIQQAIPAGAALVEIVSYQPYDAQAKVGERSGAGRYVAYVLRSEGAPAWVDLGESAAIDAEVAKLRSALKDPQRGDVRQLAGTVEERVMRPVRKLLGETRQVFLSPDGDLNLLPFAALVDEGGKYLVETYSFAYLTSGRDLLRLQVRTQSQQPPVAIADPQFEQPAQAKERAGQSGGGVRSTELIQAKFSPLPGTAEEAQALNTAVPGIRVLTGAQATEAALKQVKGPSILHVATHGFFLADRPERLPEKTRGISLGAGGEGPSLRQLLVSENPLLRSGIALAGANQNQGGAGEDGILTGLEAAGLDLWGTKLVVLSACETGVGEVKNGDGVYGMRRALVLAGSESQVISLWQVSDAATRDLMVEYYKRLQAGEGRTEALRQVQLGMLRGDTQGQGGPSRGIQQPQAGGDAGRGHPFYWAAFIQSGDWTSIKGEGPAKP